MNTSNTNSLENRKKFIPAKIIKNVDESDLHIKLLDKPVRVRAYQSDQVYVTKEERQEASDGYAPKRYITKCYFQPKQNPVSYSETVILTLGSSKKHYFETVMYQTKLIPFRWSETMTTCTPEQIYEAHHEASVKEPEFHYMSLEPQQIAAAEELSTPKEIAV